MSLAEVIHEHWVTHFDRLVLAIGQVKVDWCPYQYIWVGRAKEQPRALVWQAVVLHIIGRLCVDLFVAISVLFLALLVALISYEASAAQGQRPLIHVDDL